jgi:hypothetical protein
MNQNDLMNPWNRLCEAGYNHGLAPCPVHQPEYPQLPMGFGFRIEWKGPGYGVNGCASFAEARHQCAEFAERGGLVFRKHWWELWRPADPRIGYPLTGDRND